MEISLRPIFENSQILFEYEAICLELCLRNLKDKIMRGNFFVLMTAIMMMSCSKEAMTGPETRGLDYEYGRDLGHEMIVLGDRLENPYTTENMTKALQELYPTKADRVDVRTTDFYVRFLPENEEEYELLESLLPDMMDHPLDYDIKVEGDWYHDPSIPEGQLTWQYAVVPKDFEFPDIRYEMIDECFISENDPQTRADGIDWEAVEMESYKMTGNGDMLVPQTKASRYYPAGRLTIVDENYCGGKPLGISGVRVSCNSFVRFAKCYTDRDGYYQMSKKFSAKLRYRIIFKNVKGFAIGFNLVFVPGSISTLGKSSPQGISMTVTKDSEAKLFRRSVVNNAAYDYYERCSENDMDILKPPANIRFWILNSMQASSAVMLHHGAVLKNDLLHSFLGAAASVLSFFLPDITIGTKGMSQDYNTIYSTTCHELAHASHFRRVGTEYWDKYIFYIVESYVKTMGMTYGDGSGDKAGYCEVGEMWAYYLESKMYKERYGGGFPTFGTSYWFYPQILRSLDDRGLGADKIFSVLDIDVNSRDSFERALKKSFPGKSRIIEQIFAKHQ